MAEDYKLPQLPYFIVFGNCLVDYSVTLETEDLLKRYNFKPNQLGEVRRKELNTMLEDIKKDKNLSVQKQLGGSALTTARILSKLGQSEVVFCGSVGNDDHGNFIKEEVQQLEIRT
ncbi:hypothetical protein Bhyg_06614 [Pseudolycoriella hygida]|uniref:Adenosine kinase n=1 Tax=Pseudolycoriella hygida TaxID=35572 RepID=A0A9Q0N126_9DIPT|nr:hypothetical protein Bhyg_06614 [Pseudolycoriella hygida]